MQIHKRHILNLASYLVLAVAFLFLLIKFWQGRAAIQELHLAPWMLRDFFICSALYTLNATFVIFAWYRLLIFFGEKNPKFKDCYTIYAKSQIARYIPGNIFHVPARHIAGHNLGYKHGPLAGAAIYEIFGTVLMSGIIVMIGYLTFNITIQQVSSLQITVVLVVAFFLPVIFNKVAPYIPVIETQYLLNKKSLQVIRELTPIFFLYGIFFVILGSIFVYVADSFSRLNAFNDMGKIFTAFIVSVAAGFVTPGAPGGLGVREAVMVYLLGDLIGQKESLEVAIFFRSVTVFGDMLLFMIPIIIRMIISARKVDA